MSDESTNEEIMARDLVNSSEFASEYEFDFVYQQLAMVARIARTIPDEHVQRFVQEIGRAESIGFIFDPTAYRATDKRLEIMKAMANGFLKFKASLPSFEQAKAADDHAHQVMKLAGRTL